ncbi:MAG: ADP-ribosylglycohydrolase family protein [Oscillospiraceae bacterium]|nr:ADP-ribosylglycohydrolase family protein [Oscillospiraceae bacterium]
MGYSYPKTSNGGHLVNMLNEYGRLKHEYGASAEEIEDIINKTDAFLKQQLKQLTELPVCAKLSEAEPNDLKSIKALRTPKAERVLWKTFDADKYENRLKGALYGRMAGCTLGAPVEFWPIDDMEDWAGWIGDAFPNKHYWSKIKNPNGLRYSMSSCYSYTSEGMDGVPVDDDIAYTLLGLLIAEDCGLNFTTEDAGRCWVKYLPYACTAEDIALRNLKNGIPADKCGETDNPYVQWIGADIRSDPFGYLAPGLPETAAEMAYYEAYVSHRRNGIYGEMFFSAALAAAFAVSDPFEALNQALCEIPHGSLLYKDISWALNIKNTVKNYRHARELVDDYFKGMSGVHTNNNAALTIFGLQLGGDDFAGVIGNTVAMGLDNDCTGATAGSLFGAVYGFDAIDKVWYEKFNNKILSYLNGLPVFEIDDVLNRFKKLAKQNFS